MKDVLEEDGPKTVVEKYVKLRRDTVAMWIVNRPIYEACVEGKRERWTSARRQRWWEQSMGLEFVEEFLDDHRSPRIQYYAGDNGQASRCDQGRTLGGNYVGELQMCGHLFVVLHSSNKRP